MLFAAFVLSILSIILTTWLFQSSTRSHLNKIYQTCHHTIFGTKAPLSTPQQPFPFLKLPPEIRLQIYRYALPQRQTIIITRPSALQCPFPSYSPLPSHLHPALLRLHYGCPCQTRLTPPFLPLLQTCSLIRREAQTIFYAHNSFLFNIDLPKTLLRIPDLLALFEHGTSDGGEILGMIKDFRIRVGGNVMVDVCGPSNRWRKYGRRVLVSTVPSDEITGMLRGEENIARCVGKVLEDIGEGDRMSVGLIRKILDEMFWNWEGSA